MALNFSGTNGWFLSMDTNIHVYLILQQMNQLQLATVVDIVYSILTQSSPGTHVFNPSGGDSFKDVSMHTLKLGGIVTGRSVWIW